jgi:hypothetical protein
MCYCDFLSDLITSILGSAIVALMAFAIGYFKWYQPFRELKKSGVTKVYPNQSKAEKSILNAIKSSDNICLLAVKGETFSDKQTEIGSYTLSNTNITQKYLISDSAEKNEYIKTREEELPKNKTNPLSISLENSYKLFVAAKNANPQSIKIERHCEIVRFRIIILDNCLFLSFQKKDKQGKDCQMLQISKNSPMYQTYTAYFNDLWKKYPTPPD